ncbi:hypothetical protein NQZ79_g7191 [Umbelopsis isabellina]|nr:hypothetical protein NQZ79_g7191 [Umbelopsis isabellina]
MPETRLQKRLRQSYQSLLNAAILHDSTSKNTDYPIATKSEPTIGPDNKKKSCRTKGTCQKVRRLETASSMNQDNAPGLKSVTQLLHLPAEILLSISSYLKPSELCSSSRICTAFRNLIEMLPIWQKICTSLVLGKPARKYNTYYALATSQMWRICDLCLTRSKGWGSDSPLTIKDTNDNKIGRLCCKCRCDYYEKNPEPAAVVWDGLNRNTIDPSSKVTKSTATLRYKLFNNHLRYLRVDRVNNPHYRNAAPMRLYLETDVVDLARKVHGGDIGIIEAREASRARGIQMRKSKNRKIHERREILHKLLTDNGLEHHRDLAVCATFVSGHTTVDQLLKDLQERERQSQAQEARKSLVRKKLASHDLPGLIHNVLIVRYIRDGHGSIDEIIRPLVNQVHEKQRVATVKKALKIRLKNIDPTLAHGLYFYDDIIKDPSNDIESLLKTIVCKERNRIAQEARRQLLLNKLTKHSLGYKIVDPRFVHYIATGATDINNVVQTVIDEANKNKRKSKLKWHLMQHGIHAWTNAQAKLYEDSGEPDLEIVVNAIIEERNGKELRHGLLKARLMENHLRIPPGDAICQGYINGISKDDIDTVLEHVTSIPHERELQKLRKTLIFKLSEYGLRADCIELDICTKCFEGTNVDVEEICTIIKETSWYMQDIGFQNNMYYSSHYYDMLSVRNIAVHYYQTLRSSEKLTTIANRLLESWLTDRFDLGYYSCVEAGTPDAVTPPKSVWPLMQSKWLSKLTGHVFTLLLNHSTFNNIDKWQSLLDTNCQEAEQIAMQHLNQIGKDRRLLMHRVSQSTLQRSNEFFDAKLSPSTVSFNNSALCYNSGDSSRSGDSLASKTNGSSHSSSNNSLFESSTGSQIVSKESETLSDILRQGLGADWLRQVLEF